MKILLTHPKDANAAQLENAVVKLQALLQGQEIEITTGRQDFNARFGEVRNPGTRTWTSWAYDAAKDYDLYVSPQRHVGKAVATMLDHAMWRAPVLAWNMGTGETFRVSEIVQVSDSWKDGWILKWVS